MFHGQMVIRPYDPNDRRAVEALLPRLCIGAAAWIDPDDMLGVVRRWVDESLAGGTVFVAERDGTVVGFVTVTERPHFTGRPEAYVGELAVAEDSARSGVGRALMAAVEDWARERGLARVSLDTGAANAGARRFYEALGYEESDVRLTKAVT